MTVLKQHSSYWLDKDLWNDDEETSVERLDVARIARLAAVRRAIANFVSILSGKNLPVMYSSGKQSYTDGESVVISAEEDTSKFDTMVGLALHEGSHILLSDFSVIRALSNIRTDLNNHIVPHWWIANSRDWNSKSYQCDNVLDNILPKSLQSVLGSAPDRRYYDDNSKYYKHATRMLKDIQDIMNILEDRRIDMWVYRNAQGYRPYYDALYNKYFFTAEIGKNLRFNPEWREITIENYINRLLLCIHPASDSDAMPGLRELINMMDLQNIERVAHDVDWNTIQKVPTFNEMPTLWKEACNLYAHILKFTGLAIQQNTAPQPPVDSFEELLNNPQSDLPNLDGAPTMTPVPVEQDVKGKKKIPTPGKFNSKKAQKELKDIQKVMDGQVKKKSITKAEKEAVEALDKADAKMVDIKGDGIKSGKCMITRKVTKALLDQDWFIFGSNWTSQSVDAAIAAGRRMGAILHHRLQVRNDPMMTKQTRLPNGGLDRRLLAQLGMEITSVFQKSRVDSHKPVVLHLSLDASGSMNGKKWEKVVTVATAIAYVSSKLQNVECVISVRGGNDLPMVAILFDSRKDQYNSFTSIMRHIRPAGATPEGLAFKATLDLILEYTDSHDVYFINFSDGEPAFSWAEKKGPYSTYINYGGDFAAEHTRKQIRTMREAGVKILSYFISDGTWKPSATSKRLFDLMYGQDASYVDVKNAGEVLRTLNKLLLNRGT